MKKAKGFFKGLGKAGKAVGEWAATREVTYEATRKRSKRRKKKKKYFDDVGGFSI